MSVSPYMLQRLIATARQQAEQIQSLQQRLQQVERQPSTTTSTTEVDRAMVEQLVNARVQATRLTFADLSDAEKESLRGRDGADGGRRCNKLQKEDEMAWSTLPTFC